MELLMESFDSFLAEFKKNYTGNKIAVVAAGGGVSVLDMVKLPGASQILHSFYAPYATEESVAFIKKHVNPVAALEFENKCVSAKSVNHLFAAEVNRLESNGLGNIKVVSITAALTTHRYRRGLNHAYISTEKRNYYVKLPKLPDYMHDFRGDIAEFKLREVNRKRIEEDRLISRVALCLVADFNSEYVERLEKDETIERL
jgi:hypothetical protein